MTPTIAPGTPVKAVTNSAEIQKNVENHKKAALNLEAAAKLQTEAAKHHEEGNHEKAALSTLKTFGFLSLAKDALREDTRQHALSTTAVN